MALARNIDEDQLVWIDLIDLIWFEQKSSYGFYLFSRFRDIIEVLDISNDIWRLVNVSWWYVHRSLTPELFHLELHRNKIKTMITFRLRQQRLALHSKNHVHINVMQCLVQKKKK